MACNEGSFGPGSIYNIKHSCVALLYFFLFMGQPNKQYDALQKIVHLSSIMIQKLYIAFDLH